MELAKTISRSGTRAEIVHRSEFLATPCRASVATGVAGRLHELLAETTQETRVIVVNGTLTGVRWKNQTFDLEVPDGEDTTTIHGSIVTDVRDRVRDLFDGPVRAELEETVTTGPVIEEPRTTYRLVDVRRPAQ